MESRLMGRMGIVEWVRGGEYARVKSRLSGMTPAELAADWAALGPVEKLAVFKLLPPQAALAFFATLSFEDKYFVFCGFDFGTIAPLIEDLPAGRRTLFERLDRDAYREMLRLLSDG